MEFRKQVLDNGLEIVVEHNPRAYSLAMGFFVRAGARDESSELAGVSHFLEHMAFKGTSRRSAAEINRGLDDIGSHANAYTSEEQTVYYAALVPDYQDQAIDLLCDMMRPALRKDDFEVEKKVIVEEIHKYDDQPPFGAHEKCLAAFFGQHPLGNNVLGSVASVSALTPDAMRAYFDQRYSASNMTLVATGNLNYDRLVREMDRATRGWKSRSVTRDRLPAQGQRERRVIHRESATQEYVIQISSGPDALDDSRFAHRLMTVVFGDDSGSRLYWKFVDTGLAEFASCGAFEYEGAGITMVYLGCDPEDVAELLQELSEMQDALESDGVTEEELELAKCKTCSQIVRRSEKPSNRLFSVGNNWVQRRTYRNVQDSLASYRRVTTSDVQAALSQFHMSQHAMVLAGPLTESLARSL